jgi:hypothetical protein
MKRYMRVSVVVVGAFLAGCGGDGDDASSSESNATSQPATAPARSPGYEKIFSETSEADSEAGFAVEPHSNCGLKILLHRGPQDANGNFTIPTGSYELWSNPSGESSPEGCRIAVPERGTYVVAGEPDGGTLSLSAIGGARATWRLTTPPGQAFTSLTTQAGAVLIPLGFAD